MLIICAGQSMRRAAEALALLSGHLIFNCGVPLAELNAKVELIFRNLERIGEGDIRDFNLKSCVGDCIMALDHVLNLGWISFQHNETLNVEDDPSSFQIDLDEYIHYDDSLNGALHLIDPYRLLIFRTPSDLPDHRTWMDLDNGQRIFSAAHYINIFQDFQVQLVVRCCPASYDDSSFRAADIEIEEIPEDPTALLAAVDRFMALCSVVPGCIAVEYGEESCDLHTSSRSTVSMLQQQWHGYESPILQSPATEMYYFVMHRNDQGSFTDNSSSLLWKAQKMTWASLGWGSDSTLK